MNREFEKFLMALIVLAFSVGLYLGGLVQHRKAEPELARGRRCLELMGEANAEYQHLAGSVLTSADFLMKGYERRAYERLLLESRVLQAGYEPRVYGLSEREGGRGGTWFPSDEKEGARGGTWFPSDEKEGARGGTWFPHAKKGGEAQ